MQQQMPQNNAQGYYQAEFQYDRGGFNENHHQQDQEEKDMALNK
jgi:hypothetical protein